ncbi:MAG: flagellar hook-basal body complex protein, partial [Candidatus Poribacteria bacterium]|nr:flagellar hook-basal body complex protein [Candidatus Poribacteria bacterium]
MMRALWSSASGMVAQQKNIDVISNNISNVNTVGFKGSRADFQDLIYQVIQPAGTLNQERTIPTGIEIGHGTQLVATPTRFAQGDLKDTEDTLDIAIQGEGFFRIRMPDGQTTYTRAGAFTLDGTGNLVTANGLPLDPSLQVPPEAEDVLIAEDGTVSTRAAGDIDPTIVGNIQLALFP